MSKSSPPCSFPTPFDFKYLSVKQIYGSKSRNALSLVLIISIGIHFVALFAFWRFLRIVENITSEEKDLWKALPIDLRPEVPPDTRQFGSERNQPERPAPPQPRSWSTARLERRLPGFGHRSNSGLKPRPTGRSQGVSYRKRHVRLFREMAINLTEFRLTAGLVEGALERHPFRHQSATRLRPPHRNGPASNVNSVKRLLTPRRQKDHLRVHQAAT